MKLSTKGRYGLRALIDIAVHEDQGPVSVSDIAARQAISEAYLEQLLPRLRKASLITSQRGAAGGYRLTRPASEISVGDVLRAMEGSLDAVACAGLSDEGCAGADSCVTKYVWKRINESIAAAVDEIWLSSLVEESRKTEAALAGQEGGEAVCRCTGQGRS